MNKSEITSLSFVSPSTAVSFLESVSYGENVIIAGTLFYVSKWNYDHIILTRNGDYKKYRYNFKS